MAMEREEAGVDEDAPLRAQPAASGRWQMRQAMCAVWRTPFRGVLQCDRAEERYL